MPKYLVIDIISAVTYFINFTPVNNCTIIFLGELLQFGTFKLRANLFFSSHNTTYVSWANIISNNDMTFTSSSSYVNPTLHV